MDNSKNRTLRSAAEETGLSRSRISQLVRGYYQNQRKVRYLPLLDQGEHWVYEEIGNRPHTMITPAGIQLLKELASGKVRQNSERVS